MLQNRTTRNLSLGGGGLFLFLLVGAVMFFVAANPFRGTTLPSVSRQEAPLVAPTVAPPDSSRIEPQVAPTPTPPDFNFRGRPAPSTAFPLSDEEYIEAGKRALADSNTEGVSQAFKMLGNPSYLDVAPLWVVEAETTLTIFYETKDPSGNVFRRMGQILVVAMFFNAKEGWSASVQERPLIPQG